MMAPTNRRHSEETAQPQRSEQRDEEQREEDMDGLMEAVAEALSQAERDALASQAAREAARERRDHASVRGELSGQMDGAAGNFLHEVLQATGRNLETTEASKRRKGKAPAGEETMRTPEATAHRQTTPATARYREQT
jgi:hypothetical protein